MLSQNNFRICNKIGQCLKELQDNPNLAIITSRYHFYNDPGVIQDDIFCFPKGYSLQNLSITFSIEKQWHLSKLTNEIIQNALEFGLIDIWKRNTTFESQSKSKNGKVFVVIEIRHLTYILILFSTALVLCLVAFLIELGTAKSMKKKNPSKMWTFCDMLVDDNRYVANFEPNLPCFKREKM